MKYIVRKVTTLIIYSISFLMLISSCNVNDIDNHPIVFKDVNVITMCNDSILWEKSVLVINRKIAGIGNYDEMKIPKDAKIINARKRFLIPGLCDMHVHLSDDDDRLLYVANGVTLIRNMSGWPEHLELRKKINSGQLIGPEIYTTGPILDGLNPYWPKISIVIDDKAKVFEALSQMKKEGYDALKVYENLTKEVYYEIIRVAKVLNMPVVGHVPNALNIRDVLFSGQTSIEHFDGYEEIFSVYYTMKEKNRISDFLNNAISSIFKSNKSDTCLYTHPLIDETVKSGIWNCPTLLIHKNYENLTYLKKNPPKEIKYVSAAFIKYWEGFPEMNRDFEMRCKLLYILTNRQAKLVAGTDVSQPYVIAGFSLHDELAIRQYVGLTPYQILLSATRNCAEMLGYESRLGTIEIGKDADLVLLKNNPLENINNTKSILGVMAKGRWYSRKKLDLLLDEVEAKRNH